MMPTAMDAGSVLTRTVEELSAARTLDRVTAVVAQAARDLADADGATFVLREDGVCFYADEKAIGPLWKGMRFPADRCVSGWAMGRNETVIIPDVFADDRVPHDAYRVTFVKSMCVTPVRREDPVAAIGTYWSDGRTPGPAVVRQLELLADTAAVALENLELRSALIRRAAERDSYAERADELEAAMHSLVHDLRSPIGAMIGYADLIAEGPDPDKTVRYAETILRAGERVTAQIDRMLAIYRITNHPITPERVDLTRVARTCADELLARAGTRRIRIDIAAGLDVIADPVLTELVMENLLANAVKYTARTAEARIEVDCVEIGHPLSTFVVRDNGVGFDQADAELLFRPLSRLHTDAEFPGTGLGLASVARIVGMHGGTVRAEGVPGQGAEFSFSLPVPD